MVFCTVSGSAAAGLAERFFIWWMTVPLFDAERAERWWFIALQANPLLHVARKPDQLQLAADRAEQR